MITGRAPLSFSTLWASSAWESRVSIPRTTGLAGPAAGRGQVINLVQPGGAYAIGRLLPGDYLLAALPDEALAGDHDTDFYEALARVATRVTVGDGDKKTLELRLVRSLR